MTKRNRDEPAHFNERLIATARERPLASAAVVAGVAGAAATGAFLWTKRDRISEAFRSGMIRISELRAERIGRSQEEISEEALTLKETGKKSKGPRGPLAQQDIKAGLATVS